MLDAEADHRRHAIIEQVIADLKNGPLAHLPSGSFTANSAWLVLAAIAFNLTRAAGALASAFHARATTATIRAQLINVAARDRPLRPTHPTAPTHQLALGTTPGTGCSPPRPDHPHRPDRPAAASARPETSSGKAGQTGSPPTPARQPTEREINHTAITATAVDLG